MRSWHQAGVAAVTLLTTALVSGLVGTGAASAAHGTSRGATRDATLAVRTASFNVLGSEHTRHSRRYDSGVVRAGRALRWLDGHGVSVVGMQEAQRDQMDVLTRPGTGWSGYPDWRVSRDTETAQAVLWRSADWTEAQAHTLVVPFNRGKSRELPVVLLQHRDTGTRVWVVSVHLTAGNDARSRHERVVGTRLVATQARELATTGTPVIVAGDMNDHERFFCQFTALTPFTSAMGGSHAGACRPPAHMRIDWLFATPSVTWSDLAFADDRAIHRITDHSVPVATAHVPTAPAGPGRP
jgi:endonuclease/exonuclease/phosphatase family metal-dependent hydrolase